MSTAIFVLVMMNLAYIGSLPVFFFRRDGTLNYKWWLTAAPFFLSTLFVALHYVGLMHPWYGTNIGAVMEATATAFSSLSIALISYTLGTHRRRLSLWHQRNDSPEHIVTEGAYKYIRHPFYTAFIATLLATATLCGSPWAFGVCIWGFLMLTYTAAREETHLQESPFATQYKAYITHSGRFLPNWRQWRQVAR
jgi:protein-S-isoprenylcysteine O-methyltransferase Ste14